MQAYLRTVPALFSQPARLLRRYPHGALRADLLAGVTVGLVLLPQSLAFALLAGLPPIVGLYSALTATVIGALWGSSSHLNSGPTNTAAIITLSVIVPIAPVGSPEFVTAAGLIAVMAGLIRLLMGVARLGMLVNFVSDAVAIGFTAGAGLLILSNQIGPLLRVEIPAGAGLLTTLGATLAQIGAVHLPSLAVGLATMALILLAPRLTRRVPAVLLGVVVAAVAVGLLGLEGQGVRLMGAVPPGLPPLAAPPILDLGLVGQLANGALALAIIGLVEAVAIARAIAGYSGERIDSNQEFVGQGLANIAAGLFSGMPCSGSFNRSALAYQSGGRTALTAVAAGLAVLLATTLLGGLLAALPRAALAGSLAVTAWSMIDRRGMARIWRGARGEALIMVATLTATLVLPLQFAVLIGVLMSLGYYLLRTATPRVEAVVPDAEFRHWEPAGRRPLCPQLIVVDLLGDLYFGAVSHVEDELQRMLDQRQGTRFMLLRMHSVQQCDISGIRALESVRRVLRVRGGDLYFVRVRVGVLERMRASGFYDQVGAERFLDEDQAIGLLFHHTIDPAVCIYECEHRVFRECESLPKQPLPGLAELPASAGPPPPRIAARDLWEQLRGAAPPVVIDVREPREYQRGHIPGARNLPLSQLLGAADGLPAGGRLVLVCRSGRRSARAASLLAGRSQATLALLDGGMLAWSAANLLEAVP